MHVTPTKSNTDTHTERTDSFHRAFLCMKERPRLHPFHNNVRYFMCSIGAKEPLCPEKNERRARNRPVESMQAGTDMAHILQS